MSATRRAEASRIRRHAERGTGTVTAPRPSVFADLPASGPPGPRAVGVTSPEELVAAAHASCFSMAFSVLLTRAGTPPSGFEVGCEVTFDKVDTGWRVSRERPYRGGVFRGPAGSFRPAAEAREGRLSDLEGARGNVALSVEATLEG